MLNRAGSDGDKLALLQKNLLSSPGLTSDGDPGTLYVKA